MSIELSKPIRLKEAAMHEGSFKAQQLPDLASDAASRLAELAGKLPNVPASRLMTVGAELRSHATAVTDPNYSGALPENLRPAAEEVSKPKFMVVERASAATTPASKPPSTKGPSYTPGGGFKV
ncbi:MAG TPA: hypothetical protein VHB73_06950 [Alphaproteobacteria bacterium]|nr:hypothetical protein [Alphaproteobacteria bacterium]